MARIIFKLAMLSALLAATALGKERLVVLTDISNEPDDEQSLVRLLVYSNEFDLEGIVATTSVWLRDKVRPDIIRNTIEAYGEVRANLLLHAPGFPTKEQFLGIVKASCPEFGMAGVGDGKSTAGSRHIVDVVDRADTRPVWIAVWGGANCLAQALWDLRRERTPDEVDAFVARLRVYAISDQDDAGYWLRRTFPNLFYMVSPTTVEDPDYASATWTGISSKSTFSERMDLVVNDWLNQHVRKNHGPLGALYPEIAYIMEGDTPSFLNLIDNGLASFASPGHGGWGGRYELRTPHGESRPIWTNSRDTVRLATGQNFPSDQATIWRWREAYQHDFAARMDWCVQPFAGANHNPVAIVNGTRGKGIVEVTARVADRVTLRAAGSHDLDGDALSYFWFHYPEATIRPRNFGALPLLEIEGARSATAAFSVPAVKEPATFHVILEVKDSGKPALYSYRRVLINVMP